ncbi:MAG TPA: AMP-binding protein [Acidimicrobiales bacterium]|jgi:fatty-acyl-CoA synthase|nr:AMP-binding protein [Acidimicrobiales bacterium]
MSSATAAGPTSMPLFDQTIGENLADIVSRFGDRDALIVPFQNVRLTYTEFAREVDTVARALLAAGLVKGDRVGIWSPNNAEWVLVQYATARVGVVLVNINPAYRTHEVKYALEQSGCRFLISATDFKTSDYRAMIDEIRGDVPGLERIVFLGTEGWNEFIAAGESVAQGELEAHEATLDCNDPINIQYTSGTTGFPKGATLSHRNLVNNGFFVGEGCRYTDADRVCIPVPFYHCFGMVLGNLGCTTHGAAMVVPAPAFEPAATLQTVQDERCTSLYGVPTMFIAELALANFADYDLSSLRTGIMAGSPCPVEIMKQCVDKMNMSEVTIAYGMTETSPVSTQTAADDPLDKRVGSVGRVHPHVEISVVDPEKGITVGYGEPGELCTRGYSVMLGYWNDPDRTADAIDDEGWMHTGDLAVMDIEGYVNIVGRIKDMVIRGGENVYPREVEEFLYTHPDIVDVQVIGVPDAKYGEEIMAWIRVREGAALSTEDVAAFCQGKIAHYKVPRYVHVTEEFPMTVTGKVQKYLMREASIEMLGLQDAANTQTA